MKIRLERVRYMPKVLAPGVLYVSEEFGAAAHLCPCGCGSKVRTPLGPTDWKLSETKSGPSLYPSVGNWQQDCRSHYWIWKGEVKWSDIWTPEEIAAAQKNDVERSKTYYENINTESPGRLKRFWRWLMQSD